MAEYIKRLIEECSRFRDSVINDFSYPVPTAELFRDARDELATKDATIEAQLTAIEDLQDVRNAKDAQLEHFRNNPGGIKVKE